LAYAAKYIFSALRAKNAGIVYHRSRTSNSTRSIA
jgi:hypothetical protein